MAKELTKDQKTTLLEAEELLNEVRTDPIFARKMRERGYDDAVWGQGQQLVDNLQQQGHARTQAESDRFHATKRFHELCDLTWDHTLPLVQNCKTLFQGRPDLLIELGLHQSIANGSGKSRFKYPKKNSRFDQRAAWQRNLFRIAQTNAEIAAVLAEYGNSPEYLAECAALVEAMFDAYHTKERAAAAVTRVVGERNDAYDRLLRWLVCAQRVADKVRQKKRRTFLPPDSEA